MYLLDLFRQIFFSLWSHKIRTCLALFGIVWGTVTVILLLAVGNGFYAASMKNLSFLNNGTIFGWAGTTSKPYAGLPEGQKLHLQEKDLLDIMRDIPAINSFSPVYSYGGEIHYQNKLINASIQGVAAGYDETQQFVHAPGSRFINPLDIAQKKYVVYISEALRKTFFGKQDAIGKTITIRGIPFTVIGLTDPNNKGAIRFNWGENTVFIPYTTYLAIFGQQDIRLIFITPKSGTETARIKQNLKNLLAVKLHYDPTDKEAFHFPDLENTQVFFTWFFRIVEIFLGFCGILTLSVGGLGTANMMFLIVTERTREIGLRMALGAEQFHIMLQFLLETLMLVSLGGVIGSIISGIILALLHELPLPEWLGSPHVSWFTASVTIIILAVVGLGAGYFPARRAANMEPVRALAF